MLLVAIAVAVTRSCCCRDSQLLLLSVAFTIILYCDYHRCQSLLPSLPVEASSLKPDKAESFFKEVSTYSALEEVQGLLLLLQLVVLGLAADLFQPTVVRTTITTLIKSIPTTKETLEERFVALLEKLLAVIVAIENNVWPSLPVRFSQMMAVMVVV